MFIMYPQTTVDYGVGGALLEDMLSTTSLKDIALLYLKYMRPFRKKNMN